MTARRARGFTLVEVLVALLIVAMGLAALMTSVSGAARASGFLRDKAQAQWIALNRIVEVRLNLQKFGQNTDTGELDFANRHWHYDTRYFDTSVKSMRRVVVRVWLGTADTKSNPIAESSGFLGTALSPAGGSNTDWTVGSTLPAGSPGAGNTTQPQGEPPGSSGASLRPIGSGTMPPTLPQTPVPTP